MDYKIDINDACERQNTINTYALYFHIITQVNCNFDIGHLIISLLLHMVEVGTLNDYCLKSVDVGDFILKYFSMLEIDDDVNEITIKLIDGLSGAKSSGEMLKFKTFTGTRKLAYIEYDTKKNGFKITNKGLEFLISSKEIPEEAKLSVSLYLFKMQVEHKKFVAALDTIRAINLQTIKQLGYKEEILAMNLYNQQEAVHKYKKYWEDYYTIRKEEDAYYQDATEKFKLYKDVKHIEENNIKLKPEELEVLRLVEIELAKSSILQSEYTKQISAMPDRIREIDLALIKNSFSTLFNLEEHFESLIKNNSSVDDFMVSLSMLFKPKKVKRFSPVQAFEQQKVLLKKEDYEPVKTDNKKESILDIDLEIEKQMENNYLSYFKMLIEFLTINNNCVENLSHLIAFMEQNHAKEEIESMDFLSFLFSLNHLSSDNIYGEGNAQALKFKRMEKYDSVKVNHTEEILSKFWFDNMKKEREATLFVSTDVKDLVHIGNDRSIYNMKIKLEVNDEQ